MKDICIITYILPVKNDPNMNKYCIGRPDSLEYGLIKNSNFIDFLCCFFL